MRAVDCWQVRVAYGRIAVRPDGMCEIDVFVQEVDGMRIQDECAPTASIIHGAAYAMCTSVLLGCCNRQSAAWVLALWWSCVMLARLRTAVST